jgi:tetratricopeptide (TPR) repeat protein
MKRFLSIMYLVSIVTILPGATQPVSQAPFSLRLTPGLDLPLGQNAELFLMGGGAGISFQYLFPATPAPFLSASIAYGYAPARIGETFSVLSAGIGAGLHFLPLPWLSLSAAVSGGYYYGLLNDLSRLQGSGFPFVSASAEGSLLLTPWLSIGVGAEYKWLIGLYGALSPYVATAIHFGGGAGQQAPSPALPAKPEPLQSNALEIKTIGLEKVFPVFFSSYNAMPLGKVELKNNTTAPVTDVKVSFFVSTYMDTARELKPIPEIKAGQSETVDLYALFNDAILNVTEGKQVAATITADFRSSGTAGQAKTSGPLEILYRNAMNWEDDRRAAVFVTSKDPAVLGFVKNVKSMVQGKGGGALDANLRMGIALHEALSLHGLVYTPDPKNSFDERKKVPIDFLQFPRETLEYKGGDCDDLSILYCALLESVGVETAFITVPGHIYMAFALAMTPDEARKSFTKFDELVFREEKAWVPLEVTLREGGFLQAWLMGAREWLENTGRDQARFYPVRDAWKLYTPVQLPGAGTAVALPPAEKVAAAFQNEVTGLINREIGPKLTEINAEIAKTQNSAKAVNKLGVLFARYEQWDRAEGEFQRILQREEYVPALLNIGNIQALKGDPDAALAYYERALGKEPNNAKVVLAIARLNHEQQNYGQVSKLYKKLKELSPELATQYAYLDLRGEEATRAADASQLTGKVLWDGE